METRTDRLGKNFDITTSKRHGFGTDAVLLSRFAPARNNSTICELGTGCGIISMMINVWGINAHIDAVDIQPDAIELLEQTVKRNGLTDRINPVCCDLKQLKGVLDHGSYDLVVCNPPYRRLDSGVKCADEGLRIARFEVCADIYDICREASKLLKTGGSFCLCNRPDRLGDTFEALKRSGLTPKRLRLVQQRSGGEAWLFLLEAAKGSKSQLRIMPTLIIEDDKGEYTPELKEIYGEFAERQTK